MKREHMVLTLEFDLESESPAARREILNDVREDVAFCFINSDAWADSRKYEPKITRKVVITKEKSNDKA